MTIDQPRTFAVLPAAGRSVRMGRPKLLLPWGDATVIERVVHTWRASHVDALVVVVHPDDLQLAEACRRFGADVVVAATPPPEMKDSVLIGLEYLAACYRPVPDDAWLLAPADMPELTTAAVDAVVGAWRMGGGPIVVPCHNGRRGHPVLFAWPLADEVRALGPAHGLNELVRRHPSREIELSDEAILADLDTPDDYGRRPVG